jgi:hypothetical protein
MAGDWDFSSLSFGVPIRSDSGGIKAIPIRRDARGIKAIPIRRDAGGIKAISRWSSEATPPVNSPKDRASRQGCQQARRCRPITPILRYLASLPGCSSFFYTVPVVSLVPRSTTG